MFWWILGVALAADPPLVEAVSDEMERALAELALPDAPPIYHARYKLLMLDQVDITTSFGGLVSVSKEPYNALGIELRVGAPGFDNTGFGGWMDGFEAESLPLHPTPRSTQLAAWRLTDSAYKSAIEQYSRKKAQFSPPPDYPGDYWLTGPTVGSEGLPSLGDPTALIEVARAASGALAPFRGLERGEAKLGHEAGSLWLIDSEGTRVRRGEMETTLRVYAQLRTDDGMLLTDHRLWSVGSAEAFPSVEQVSFASAAMGQELMALASAPMLEEEYVGPVVFEDTAAADVFRYLLVPQLEGTPPSVPFDSFFGALGEGVNPVRLGRRVLPAGWTASDDPTSDPSHPGAYTYDWEGTVAQAVQLVDDGIVRAATMSRVPRKGMSSSNGHGVASMWGRAEGKVSLLSVQAPRRVSQAKLYQRAGRLASSYGRDWFVVVRRLQEPSVRGLGSGGGYSFSVAEEPDLPQPYALIQRFADGTERVVRGGGFASVERWVLRDIVAAGPMVETTWMAPRGHDYTGLAPTVGHPTRVSAPQILVGEMEIVPQGGDENEGRVLPPPDAPAR